MKKGFSWVVREGDEGDLEGIFSLRRIAFGVRVEERWMKNSGDGN